MEKSKNDIINYNKLTETTLQFENKSKKKNHKDS